VVVGCVIDVGVIVRIEVGGLPTCGLAES